MFEFFTDFPLALTAISFCTLIIVALTANFAVKSVLVRWVQNFLNSNRFPWGESISRNHVIPRLSNVVPTLIMSYGVDNVPGLPIGFAKVVTNVANASTVLMVTATFSAILSTIDDIYHRNENLERSIKGYIQMVKIATFAIAGIMMISIIIDRSPVILLSGLGALAAVLMLVFQDTLLSAVASIQISNSDIIKVGDWIEMPAMNADGFVTEIALHTAKVRNWDNTVTTIPTKKLISDPIKNWRGMFESGGRRIKRSIIIDQSSIAVLSDSDIKRLSGIGLLSNYLDEKNSSNSEYNRKIAGQPESVANYRHLTNIGTLRAYLTRYLRAHPEINQDMIQIARLLQPDALGLPLEIYCFTQTVAWVEHEKVQSDILDHIYSVLPEFGLRTYQRSSDR